MATRDDHVITISYPDGTTIVEHSDGTRITTYYRENQIPADHEDNAETGNSLYIRSNMCDPCSHFVCRCVNKLSVMIIFCWSCTESCYNCSHFEDYNCISTV